MRRALKTAQTAPYVQPPTGMQAARATPLRHGLPAGKPTGRMRPHSGGPRRNGLCGNTLQGPRRHRQPGSLPWPQPSHSGHARRLCYNRPQPRHTHRCPPPQPQQRQAPATAVAERQHSGISSCSKLTYTIALAGVSHYLCHHLVCYLTAIDFEHLLKNGENNSHMGLRIQKF